MAIDRDQAARDVLESPEHTPLHINLCVTCPAIPTSPLTARIDSRADGALFLGSSGSSRAWLIDAGAVLAEASGECQQPQNPALCYTLSTAFLPLCTERGGNPVETDVQEQERAQGFPLGSPLTAASGAGKRCRHVSPRKAQKGNQVQTDPQQSGTS